MFHVKRAIIQLLVHVIIGLIVLGPIGVATGRLPWPPWR